MSTLSLSPVTLALVCRQPLLLTYFDCEHTAHTNECCGISRVGGGVSGDKLPEGHEHSYDCCTHSCEFSCREGRDYRDAFHGDHKQCAETATFTADTLTAAEDQAVAAGWRVDVLTRGVFSRSDVCPGCNGDGIGHRTPFGRVEEDFADSYAAA